MQKIKIYAGVLILSAAILAVSSPAFASRNREIRMRAGDDLIVNADGRGGRSREGTSDSSSDRGSSSGGHGSRGRSGGHSDYTIPKSYEAAGEAKSSIQNMMRDMVSDISAKDTFQNSGLWCGTDFVQVGTGKWSDEDLKKMMEDYSKFIKSLGHDYATQTNNQDNLDDLIELLDHNFPDMVTPSQEDTDPQLVLPDNGNPGGQSDNGGDGGSGDSSGGDNNGEGGGNGGSGGQTTQNNPPNWLLDDPDFTITPDTGDIYDKQGPSQLPAFELPTVDDPTYKLQEEWEKLKRDMSIYISNRDESNIRTHVNPPIRIDKHNIPPVSIMSDDMAHGGEITGIRSDLVRGGLRDSNSYAQRFYPLMLRFSSNAYSNYAKTVLLINDYHMTGVSDTSYTDVSYLSDERNWTLTNLDTGEVMKLQTSNPEHELKLMKLQKGNYSLVATQPAICTMTHAINFLKCWYLVDAPSKNILYFNQRTEDYIVKQENVRKDVPVGDPIIIHVNSDGEITKKIKDSNLQRIE